MSNTKLEYLFATHIAVAEGFANAQGWRSHGRAQWLKCDGCVVYFLSLPVQLEIVSAGETVHFIGLEPGLLHRLKRRGVICVCHEVESAGS